MRILNRPMFRYGGPIKEGVMHGMRDGGRAALVGNPVYPRTGSREHHKINIQDIKDPRKGAVKKGGIWLASKVPGFTKGWAKRMWDKYKFPSAYSPTRTSYHQTRPMMERLGKYVRQHPVLTGGGAFLGAQSEPVKGIAKGAWNLIPEVAQFGAEAIMPKEGFGPFKEKYLPPDEWWKWKSDVKWKPGDVRGEEGGGDGTGTKTGTSSRWKDIGTAPELTASQREKIRKDEQNKRLKNYLDMMGYDSSKRRALDDALIDASALVQDASTEAGSLKKADWGNLINRMIQTTSKRLDKPQQIREAVGLMMTKGEIEKDIAAGKGGPLKQNARDLVAAGVYKTEKEAMAHLGKVGSFEETLAALSAKTGNITGDMIKVAWINDTKTPPRDHFKSTDDVYKKFKEKMEDAGKNYNIELEFVDKMIDDKNPGDAFVVDDTLVIVNSDGTLDYKWK